MCTAENNTIPTITTTSTTPPPPPAAAALISYMLQDRRDPPSLSNGHGPPSPAVWCGGMVVVKH